MVKVKNSRLASFAVCHWGPGSEPGAGTKMPLRCAYFLRDEARIRRNNLAAVKRYQERNREKINAAKRARRAAVKQLLQKRH